MLLEHKPPLRDRARGQWPSILAQIGVPGVKLDKRKHQPCPQCGGKDRFRFTDKDGDGLFFCNVCKAISPVDLLMHLHGWDFAQTAKEIEAVIGTGIVRLVKPKADDAEARAAMSRLWKSGNAIVAGDFVDAYLASRAIGQSNYDAKVLRKADSIKHETEEGRASWHPAMLAKVVAPDGMPTNVHRTYLAKGGAKASVEPVRKTMWGTIAKGSAIRLMEPGPILGVAEGIETAFSASELFGIPVWAAINSTMLSGWEPPSVAQQVMIFGDNYAKFGGQAAATALAHRLACRGIPVRIEIPPLVGHDWNDVLLAQRSKAA